MIMKRS